MAVGFEVVKHLCVVNWVNYLNCFEFDNEAVSHRKVEAGFANRLSFIAQRDRPLTLKGNSPHAQFNRKGLLVSRLEKPGSSYGVDLNRSANNRTG
jgi:hypothetical protein